MSGELQPITDNVWFFPPDPDPEKVQPAVGVICSDTQTVLVDAGNSPHHARRIQAALKVINAPPLKLVIYTHAHWDHIFGACALGVPVIAHQTCYNEVNNMAAENWGPAYLKEQVAKNPKRETSMKAIEQAITDWSEFEIVLPQIVFAEKKHTLALDGLTLELEWLAGNHTPESTVVRVLERGVIFLADCFYPPPAHLRTPEDDFDWVMLKSLLDEGHRYYVDGHNGVITHDELREWLDEGSDE